MNARRIIGSAAEWTFRTAAVREARAAIAGLDERRATALRQARLLLEVASLVKFPAGRLPKGSRPAALVGLYREAIYWAFVARSARDGEPPPGLNTLWAEEDDVELAVIAGGAPVLESARRVLLETPAARTLDVSAQEAAHVAALASGLLGDIDAARKRTNKLLAQRWLRILLVVVVLGALAGGVYRLLLGRNLVAGAKIRVSSVLPSCANDPICNVMLFHTETETNPWVELDLGAAKKIRRIEVTNRMDCCQDREVPLVIETSTDRKQWSPLARRDTEFTTWSPDFAPRVARYVKLWVPKTTQFHLHDIVIR